MWWATTYTWSPCSAGAPSETAGRSTTPPACACGSRMARWPRCGSSSGTCSRSTSSGREIGCYQPPLDGADGRDRTSTPRRGPLAVHRRHDEYDRLGGQVEVRHRVERVHVHPDD